MERVDWNHGTPIARDDLPAVITAYLAAHQVRDLEASVACFTPDAVVTDDGHTYHGRDDIRAWLSRTASEYTFTTTLIGAARIDSGHYDAVQHVEGNFPGGVVDLHYRFTLRDTAIAQLVIEV